MYLSYLWSTIVYMFLIKMWLRIEKIFYILLILNNFHNQKIGYPSRTFFCLPWPAQASRCVHSAWLSCSKNSRNSSAWEKRLFLRKITLKIIFFSTKFCFHAHEKRRPQDVSIALDFLAQETRVSHAHAKRSSTRVFSAVLLECPHAWTFENLSFF